MSTIKKRLLCATSIGLLCIMSSGATATLAKEYSGKTGKGKITVTGQDPTSSSSGSGASETPQAQDAGLDIYTPSSTNPTAPDAGSDAVVTVNKIGNTFEIYNNNATTNAPCTYQGKPGTITRVPLPITDEDNYQNYGIIPSGRGGIGCATTNTTGDNTPATENNLPDKTQQLETGIRQQLAELTTTKPALHFDGTEPHTNTGENTNFYVTNTTTHTKNVTILDENITLEAIPVAYRYNYGTGASPATSANPGKAKASRWDRKTQNYHPTGTSYAYEHSGNYHAYVTVIYQGRYRIEDGTWNIIGTVETTSNPTLVRVWDTQVHSVGKTCLEDPQARGCPQHADEPDKNNPNPKLTHPDPYTGQHWHLDNTGTADTEKHHHKKK